jgi:uncharacterized RDD family membrane protein YckC
MDQRPPEGREPPEPQPPEPQSPAEPPPPEPTVAWDPTQPLTQAPPPDAWGRPPGDGTPPPPTSSILSADPLLSGGAAGGPGPEVAWAAPPSPREVPGAPGLVFAGVGTRFVAFFMDSILLAIPAIVVSSIQPVPEAATFDEVFYADPVTTILLTGLGFVYFVGFWTSGGRATPGMRMMKLQVGSAFEGRTLTLTQAVTRWALLGQPLALVSLFPPIAVVASLLSLVWTIILLVSTAASPTKQGIHDRVAGSAVVQPAGAGASGAALACLVIAVILLGLAVVSVVALVLLGGQVSSILSEVGESI